MCEYRYSVVFLTYLIVETGSR